MSYSGIQDGLRMRLDAFRWRRRTNRCIIDGSRKEARSYRQEAYVFSSFARLSIRVCLSLSLSTGYGYVYGDYGLSFWVIKWLWSIVWWCWIGIWCWLKTGVQDFTSTGPDYPGQTALNYIHRMTALDWTDGQTDETNNVKTEENRRKN